MKSIISFLFLFPLAASASDIRLSCKKLLDGNANKQAYTLAKSADINIEIDTYKEDAELRGEITTKVGRYHRENEVVQVYSYFTENRSYSQSGSLIEVKSREKGLLLCGAGSGTGPCRKWDRLVVDLKTGEALYEHSYSYQKFFGETIFETSLRLSCQRI